MDFGVFETLRKAICYYFDILTCNSRRSTYFVKSFVNQDSRDQISSSTWKGNPTIIFIKWIINNDHCALKLCADKRQSTLSSVLGDDVFAVRQGRERETLVTAGPLCVSWLEAVTTSSNATLISCVAWWHTPTKKKKKKRRKKHLIRAHFLFFISSF